MNIQSINRVELQGRVGALRKQSVSGQHVSNFSLMTEHFYAHKDGSQVCECTYHHVVAFEGGKVDTTGLSTGAMVHVTGRLRTNRYTAADGAERTFTEVIASSVKVLE